MIPSKIFVPLDKKRHNRQTFDCGKSSLNRFLKESASRGMEARVNYTWVLPAKCNKETSVNDQSRTLQDICAWYTLSMCHIERWTLPEKIAKSMPGYPLPAFILGQLAVNQKCQGQGLGDITLINAIRRCATLSQKGQVPAVAMILDVIDEQAMAFYQRIPDFRPLQTAEHELPRLFLPIKVAEQLTSH